ncbi:MAG: hypothetical protein ACPHRF_03350, partial [Porticoccaceae bacterium]
IHPIFIILYCFYYSRVSLGNSHSNQKKLFRKRNFKDFARNDHYFCHLSALNPGRAGFCKLNED